MNEEQEGNIRGIKLGLNGMSVLHLMLAITIKEGIKLHILIGPKKKFEERSMVKIQRKILLE